ncbi:rhomboid family protein [Roseivirga pacifica]|uniref:Rhomboid family protein n=1 Tax=Roseivirga pacifica TaxID=1267423 RepID=A0A1I0NN55_9BACT|nr:rhomboid family intramembrane serine protease [Roseivirga pacifica]RKQ51330.1 rhomboid family protein [Roseivirga pacifica]SEW02841.1 Rhomboid family protein [Roseivirga pacifica]
MEFTYGLMIAIGLVTYFAWQKPELHRKLMLNPYNTVYKRQVYRLFTSGFVHNSSIHLFLNLFTLYFFGGAMEKIFAVHFGVLGYAYFLLLFLTAIIVSNIPTTIKYRNQPHYNSLGASGGVSALVLAFILFDPIQELCLYIFICLPGYILGAIFIGYSIFMGKRGKDNINHDAHLYGALYGLLFILILKPSTLESFIKMVF